MTEDLNKLETEIDAMLAELSAKLTVEHNSTTIERTKSVVRHELNEQWLFEQASPTPSPRILQQVRQAIDHELQKTTSSPWLRVRIWAPLAAAALIAISVGLTNYIRTAQVSQPADIDIDIFVQALEETFENNPFTLAADMDLDAIEDNINNLAASSSYEYETLDDIGNQIDELFNEPDWLEDLSTGAVG